MTISESELRALVREAVARHTAAHGLAAPPGSPLLDRRHASHLLLPVANGSAGDGACLIEPTVLCNHCGYCQSLGH